MEMHQIRYFLEVAETLNFTRAAENCNVAQPSLSRAIRNLEMELGGELFRRERSRTHLTQLGRDMRPLLRQAFEAAAAAKAQAANYRSAARAPLRIGLSHTVHIDLLAPILRELSRALPGLELHMMRGTVAEIFAALESGDMELGIAARFGTEWDRLDVWHLFEEGFVLMKPGADREISVPYSAIDRSALIGRPYCENHVAERDGGPHRFAVTSDDDATRLVRSGVGSAIVSESWGTLTAAPVVAIDGLEETRKVALYGVAGRQRSTAANAMLTLLRAADWSSVAAD